MSEKMWLFKEGFIRCDNCEYISVIESFQVTITKSIRYITTTYNCPECDAMCGYHYVELFGAEIVKQERATMKGPNHFVKSLLKIVSQSPIMNMDGQVIQSENIAWLNEHINNNHTNISENE